jgi:F420H(2)-dependent quinone reductase
VSSSDDDRSRSEPAGTAEVPTGSPNYVRVVDGTNYVAIASNAGNPNNPGWYRNLTAYPEAEIRDGAAPMPALAPVTATTLLVS